MTAGTGEGAEPRRAPSVGTPSGDDDDAVSVRHARAKQLFAAACLEPESERFTWLARACGDDHALRREVESLLAFYQEPPITTLLVRPPRAADEKSRLRRGHVLAGRYRVERLLGVGGMGEVYAVFDAMLRETVALKIIRHADAEQWRRLLDEVRLARQVTHPGVCRVYDVGEDAGMPFLTMELIDGEDLARRLERTGPLPSPEVADIALRLASSLQAAHEAGVLHRDLKPSNILISRQGALSITDFGIATSRARSSTPGEERRFGTPAYMAPEECDPGGIATQQTDLYSLGLVLYELLTGVPAFSAPDIDTLLALQRSSSPEPPSRLLPEVDRALETLVLRLLEKDPARRPESAQAVVAALAGASSRAVDGELVEPARERRPITTLLCQLEARPERVGADGWSRLLRTFQARCFATCRLKGGRVARHLERGLLVHFGVPRAGEQDAERAIEAGLDLIADLRERPLEDAGGRLRTTLLIDSLEGTVRANEVAIAPRRLEGLLERARAIDPDHVIVSEALLPMVQSAFSTTALAGAGREGLHCIARPRRRLGLERGAARLTPFTGRELELARLEQWWRDAASGRGQVVLLSGEAGVGKSRMVHELWRRIRDEAVGFEARCSILQPNTPLFPFVRMMARAAELEPDDDAATAEAKLRRILAPLGARADEMLPIFWAWLFPASAPIAAAATPATPASDRRTAIAAIEECVLSIAQSRPLLLVCEDVHWSDPTTREAIDRLIDVVRTARVMLLLTFRDELSPPWRGTGVNRLTLQPLRADEARAMLARLSSPRRLETTAVLERADGNPLFLEELASHAGETRANSPETIPLSLRALLAARLDRLGSAKPLAQAAAVCGRFVPYSLLAALAGEEVEKAGLESALARLVDAEILLQHGPLPRATFSFRHALLREAAYASLPARERRRLHALAAAVLPDLHPDAVAPSPELLASHWTAAGRPERAFEWWRRAGLLALERSTYAEAGHHLAQAMKALPAAVDRAERPRRELELRLAQTAIEMGRGGFASPAAIRLSRRAEVLCRGLEPDDDVVHALFLSARINLVRGELTQALGKLERLLRFDHTRSDPYLHAAILSQAGNILVCLARFDEAERFEARSIEVYATARERRTGAFTADPLVHTRFTIGLIEWLRGRRAASRRSLEEGLAHADRIGHVFSGAMLRLYWAGLALLDGDLELSARLATEGRRLAASAGADWLLDFADLFAPSGDASLAPAQRARQLRRAIERCTFLRLFRSLALAELADAQASAGDSAAALLTMDEALREARRRLDRSLVPEILRRQAELLVRLDRGAEAEPILRRALAAARKSGAFGLELRAASSLYRRLEADGRQPAAHRVLQSVLARLPDDVDAVERLEAARAIEPRNG